MLVASAVQTTLLDQELRGLIHRVPDNMFVAGLSCM